MPAAAIYAIAESSNTKDEALKQIGDLNDVHVYGARVLIWTYIRPRKTQSGLYLPDKEIKEDVFQGVVGLVVKKGPAAFQDDETHKFYGLDVNVGDWVVFRPGDAPRVQIRGVDCRIIEDTQIQMVVDDPELMTHRQ